MRRRRMVLRWSWHAVEILLVNETKLMIAISFRKRVFVNYLLIRLIQLNELFIYIISTVNDFTAPHFGGIVLISNFRTIDLYVIFNEQEVFIQNL
jgi:hypothetical protein